MGSDMDDFRLLASWSLFLGDLRRHPCCLQAAGEGALSSDSKWPGCVRSRTGVLSLRSGRPCQPRQRGPCQRGVEGQLVWSLISRRFSAASWSDSDLLSKVSPSESQLSIYVSLA